MRLRRESEIGRGRAAFIAAVIAMWAAAAPARAFPVFDMSNFAQNVVTAINAARQTAKQIDEYKLQMQQWERMVKDGAADVVYTWDSLEEIYDRVSHLDELFTDIIDDISAWLEAIRTREYYRDSPCYGPDLKCYREEWRKTLQGYEEWDLARSDSQKKVIELLAHTLRGERDRLKDDLETLDQLRRETERSEGQLEAIQQNSQFLGHLASHLASIRMLLEKQYYVTAMELRIQVENEEQRKAARIRFYRSLAEESDPLEW